MKNSKKIEAMTNQTNIYKLFTFRSLIILTVIFLFSSSNLQAMQFASKTAELTTANNVTEQKITAPNGTTTVFFGSSVAISGDTMIVGANASTVGSNERQGSAYIFTKKGMTWTFQEQLTASDGAAEDFFGSSVSISGNTVVVGTASDDIGSNDNQGSAYIFTRNGTTWTQQQKLTASDGAAEDFFGSSVSISGNTVVVGAFLDDVNSNIFRGSAYIFIRNGTTWTQQQKITASDGAAYDRFGISVAISGDTVVVGAFLDDVGSSDGQGSAYIFTRNGTNWTEQKITASDGTAHSGFGTGVAVSGNTVIVGATGSYNDSNNKRGSAYIFTKNGTTWTQQQKIAPPDEVARDFFGRSVGISGNTVIVGAVADVTGGSNPIQGSAYIFTKNGTTWNFQQRLAPPDEVADDRFGSNVAISSGTAIVGDSIDNIDSNINQGSVYIFSPIIATGNNNPDTVGVFRPSNGTTYLKNSNMGGFSDIDFIYGNSGDTSISGDWDGDGKDTLGIYRNGLFYLRNTNSTGPADIIFAFGDPSDQPIAGDWDGDGIDTIGLYRRSTGVFILRNSNSNGEPDIVFVLGNPNDIAIAGDWNGDGIDTTGVFRPSNGIVYLKSTNVSGDADINFVYGNAGDKPLAGDWDGDGNDTVGIYRDGVMYLKNTNTTGFADIVFAFGNPGDEPISGDWDGLP